MPVAPLILALAALAAPPQPLPKSGGVAPMFVQEEGLVYPREGATPDAGSRANAESLRRRFFASRNPQKRAAGIEAMKAFTAPAGFQALIETLRGEGPDVQRALMDHFASQGDAGAAALAWMAIDDPDPAVRNEAAKRIPTPACNAVLAVIDGGLRSLNHARVNNAGLLAGTLNATSAIPLLIFAQFARDDVPQGGDLAWISIGTQISYVANLVPVVGDNSGAFAPVIGNILEGVVMRVSDAVVYTYRADVHQSLVGLTSYNWGQSTAYLGWDMPAWARWYDTVYVPFKQQQASPPAAAGP